MTKNHSTEDIVLVHRCCGIRQASVAYYWKQHMIARASLM